MGQLLRRHGVHTAQQQAALYYARERVRSLRDPAYGLLQTRKFVTGAVVQGTDFASTQGSQITFGFTLRQTGNSPSGQVFELSTTGGGIGFCVQGTGHGEFVAGSAVSGAGATARRLVPWGAANVGRVTHWVCSAVPGQGALNVWLDGTLVAAAKSASPWASWLFTTAATGSVGGPNGQSSTRFTSTGTLTGAALVGPLRVYENQVPRGFRPVSLGTYSAPTDSWGN